MPERRIEIKKKSETVHISEVQSGMEGRVFSDEGTPVPRVGRLWVVRPHLGLRGTLEVLGCSQPQIVDAVRWIASRNQGTFSIPLSK